MSHSFWKMCLTQQCCTQHSGPCSDCNWHFWSDSRVVPECSQCLIRGSDHCRCSVDERSFCLSCQIICLCHLWSQSVAPTARAKAYQHVTWSVACHLHRAHWMHGNSVVPTFFVIFGWFDSVSRSFFLLHSWTFHGPSEVTGMSQLPQVFSPIISAFGLKIANQQSWNKQTVTSWLQVKCILQKPFVGSFSLKTTHKFAPFLHKPAVNFCTATFQAFSQGVARLCQYDTISGVCSVLPHLSIFCFLSSTFQCMNFDSWEHHKTWQKIWKHCKRLKHVKTECWESNNHLSSPLLSADEILKWYCCDGECFVVRSCGEMNGTGVFIHKLTETMSKKSMTHEKAPDPWPRNYLTLVFWQSCGGACNPCLRCPARWERGSIVNTIATMALLQPNLLIIAMPNECFRMKS